MNEPFDELAERLDAIADELASTAIDELKSALRRGEQRRPQTERTLTQARRAVEKAAHLLRSLERGDDSADASDEFD